MIFMDWGISSFFQDRGLFAFQGVSYGPHPSGALRRNRVLPRGGRIRAVRRRCGPVPRPRTALNPIPPAGPTPPR
ncbi:hypothetical protein HMPREF1979_02362 [Actinomyces johnsonii F0542]|uniref:Uncharacterized protein n=1 Tax=Actinomyces johnsonii F0542 TaxID=1321818 RepID=U1QLG8_9ACTO|nr:hypothetical protein HMPREF1979_02362 [Actinomyces johnsonii F0542]